MRVCSRSSSSKGEECESLAKGVRPHIRGDPDWFCRVRARIAICTAVWNVCVIVECVIVECVLFWNLGVFWVYTHCVLDWKWHLSVIRLGNANAEGRMNRAHRLSVCALCDLRHTYSCVLDVYKLIIIITTDDCAHINISFVINRHLMLSVEVYAWWIKYHQAHQALTIYVFRWIVLT